jgi:hypothetical protein
MQKKVRAPKPRPQKSETVTTVSRPAYPPPPPIDVAACGFGRRCALTPLVY